MTGAVLHLLWRIALAAIVAVVFSAVLGIPFWLGLTILLCVLALERGHREPDPPEQPESPFEQTGGFPRSRR